MLKESTGALHKLIPTKLSNSLHNNMLLKQLFLVCHGGITRVLIWHNKTKNFVLVYLVRSEKHRICILQCACTDRDLSGIFRCVYDRGWDAPAVI